MLPAMSDHEKQDRNGLPSPEQLGRLSDSDVLKMIRGACQPGNLALAEMQRRTSARLVSAVDRFNAASSREANQMRCLTRVILFVAVVQLVTTVVNCAVAAGH